MAGPEAIDERPKCSSCHSFYPKVQPSAEVPGAATRLSPTGDCRFGNKQVILIDKNPKSFWPVVSAEEGCPSHSGFASHLAVARRVDKVAAIGLNPDFPRFGHDCSCVFIGKAKDRIENNKILKYVHWERPDGGTLSFLAGCPACEGTGKVKGGVFEGGGRAFEGAGDPESVRDYPIPPKPSGPMPDRPTGDDLIDGAAELASMARGR